MMMVMAVIVWTCALVNYKLDPHPDPTELLFFGLVGLGFAVLQLNTQLWNFRVAMMARLPEQTKVELVERHGRI